MMHYLVKPTTRGQTYHTGLTLPKLKLLIFTTACSALEGETRG